MTSMTMSQTPVDIESGPEADGFVTTSEASAELDGAISASWLNKARCTGEGPPFYKFGSRVVYSRRELREWAASRRRMSTSIHQAA
ncbi:MAG: hypothetical protein DHS20C03_08660 [Minwuia thermotolerans]|nr:MAG: hypothetical protein DHS20C03_08660 [Minwuia thermotolerans]